MGRPVDVLVRLSCGLAWSNQCVSASGMTPSDCPHGKPSGHSLSAGRRSSYISRTSRLPELQHLLQFCRPGACSRSDGIPLAPIRKPCTVMTVDVLVRLSPGLAWSNQDVSASGKLSDCPHGKPSGHSLSAGRRSLPPYHGPSGLPPLHHLLQLCY
jgi:hypothetical protein